MLAIRSLVVFPFAWASMIVAGGTTSNSAGSIPYLVADKPAPKQQLRRVTAIGGITAPQHSQTEMCQDRSVETDNRKLRWGIRADARNI